MRIDELIAEKREYDKTQNNNNSQIDNLTSRIEKNNELITQIAQEFTTKGLDLNFVTNLNVTNFIFQFSSAKSFNGYRWATANDEEGRDPKSWTIAGSNNGSTWTTLHTVTNFSQTNTPTLTPTKTPTPSITPTNSVTPTLTPTKTPVS